MQMGELQGGEWGEDGRPRVRRPARSSITARDSQTQMYTVEKDTKSEVERKAEQRRCEVQGPTPTV